MINQQSAARSTSSTKQRKLNFVSCLPTRPLALGRQTIPATESGTTATTKHAILQRVFSGKNNNKRVRCDTGRMHATHCFFPWILSIFTTTFAWRSLPTGGSIIFPLIFCVENVWYTLAPCHKICRRQKAGCVWSYSYVYLLRSILLAREYKLCRFVRTCIIPPSGPRGRSHSQCCCVDFSGAVIVNTTTSSSF